MQKKDKFIEGEVLKSWLKANRYSLKETAEKLGYTRQNLDYHLRQVQLSRDFVFQIEKALDIDVQQVIYPADTREKHPHKNMGTNVLNNENEEIVNQIYFDGLDKEYKTVLSLSPREKLSLLTTDNKINTQTFETLLPTDVNKKGWLPFIANVENLIALVGERTEQESRPNWPMESDDVIFNRGVNAEYSISAPYYDNMIPKVYPGEKIYISAVNKLNYRPAVPYLVCFTDKTAMIYYLSKGTKDNHVRLISHDKSYGEKEEDLNNIFCLFEIKPRI